MIDELRSEFAGKTNNQVYELAFTKRMMRRDPSNPSSFLGNTQRQDFIPHLKSLLSELGSDAQLFDIGGGAGEIVDILLKELPSAVINVEEPNPILLSQYEKRVRSYPNLALGISHCGPIQDYYADEQASPPFPADGQDLVLAVHMIYHLTDLHCKTADPAEDIKRAIGKMYDFLKSDGRIFVVFANQLVSTTGQASRYYFRSTGQQDTHDNHLILSQCRLRLLYEKGIKSWLDRQFPDSTASINSVMTDSYFFGESPADIAAMCLTAEIGESNDEPFDIEKIELCMKFVEENGDKIGLKIENRQVPQKGMYRSNQPQVVSVIRRSKKQ